MIASGDMVVLDAADPMQRLLWIDLWQRWPDREPFAHPLFVCLFARKGDRACCATMKTDQGGVIFPFVLRPLCIEPWAGDDNPNWDLTSPYGYGGPFAWGCSKQEEASFWREFEAWGKQQALVSSFVGMGLFPQQCIGFPGKIEKRGLNVVRSLNLEPDDLWRDYEHKVRKNVKHARAEGLTVSEDPRAEHLETFCKIYHDTMQRNQARESYFFSYDFFDSFSRELRDIANFFHVWRKSRIVSTELVLLSKHYVYSFLGGTEAAAFSWRPNDLLKHEVALWAKSCRKLGYVLGGGYQNRDGIFRYKLSFAPRGQIPFRVGMAIHDCQAYAELIARRSEWEHRQGRDWRSGKSFFPSYR